jgi:hypothetical protein
LIGTLVVAGITVPIWQQTRLHQVQSENTQLRVQAAELAALRREQGRLQTVKADQAELERLRQWQAQTQPELLRLRGMAGVARRSIGEAEQLRAQLAQQASEAATNPITGAMADAMKQALERQFEGRLSRMTASLRLTPEQAQAARDILMRQAQAMAVGMQQAISGKYDKEELAKLAKKAGNSDEQIKALLTPDQQAVFHAYQQEEAAHNASLAANTELLQMQSALGLTAEQLDRVYAALYEVAFNQLTGSVKQKFTSEGEAMQWALDQKTKALEPLLTKAQLENYRQQQAIQAKLVKDIMSKMEATNGVK